jgi:serine O-acetyltransferase
LPPAVIRAGNPLSGLVCPVLALTIGFRDTKRVNETASELTNKILASYATVGGINHLDGVNLPSKSAVAQITVNLLHLLFPGYFEEKPMLATQLQIQTAALVDSILSRLKIEIGKSLDYAPPGGASRKECKHLAQQLTHEFLGQLPHIRELMQTDAEAAFNGDPAALSKEEVILAYPCIEAIAIHRMAHELYLKAVPLLPRMMTEWAHARTGIDLHPGAQIGSHFFIDHGTGTVVGETSTIGNHVKMYQGVGLVARSLAAGQRLRGKKRHPTIEDGVTIYAGATIVGGDSIIGRGSTIGANVFLTDSVPAQSLVVADGFSIRVTNKADHHLTEINYQI